MFNLGSKSKRKIIPGFNLALGYTLFYLSLIVIIPIIGLFIHASNISFSRLISLLTEDRVLAALKITFITSFLAVLINLFLGFIVAWSLVRYNFWGKKLMNSLIDIPFALPTAEAGISISAIYAEDGILGKFFADYGIKISYTSFGIIIALIFVSFPFIVRTLQPVLEDLKKEVEEAATSLGANRWQIFTRIIFPSILPTILTSFSVAFARCLGEYGSVIFIAGNIPLVSEIIPLLIVIKLEQYQIAEAAVIACFMLIISFSLLFAINILQKWSRKWDYT